MNRLSARLDFGLEPYDEIAFINPDDAEGIYNLDDIVGCGSAETKLAIAERFAAYEDTGLTPEEINNLRAEIEQVRAEKEAAVKYIPRQCSTCTNWVKDQGFPCACKAGGCEGLDKMENWEWRGPQKEATHA